MTEQKRDYGVDLLRIILMIFIVIGHLYAHTEIRSQLPFLSSKWVFTWATQAVTVCAVDCFVIITGYYMSQTSFRLWRVVKLWSKVIFYSVALTAVLVAAGMLPVSGTVLLNAFFPVLRREYWFFTMYILLYLFIPFLNAGLNQMSRKVHGILVIIILLFFYAEPLLSAVFYEYDPTEGFSILAFVTLYVIGAYLARRPDFSKKICLCALIGSSLLMLLSKIALEMIVDRFHLGLGTGLLYHNNSLFVLINAAALFELFKQIRLGPEAEKAAAWLSPSVFAVYLLHEKPAVRKLIWNDRLTAFLAKSDFWVYCLAVMGIAVGIFAAGIAVEKTLTWLVFRRAEKTAAARKIRERCLRYDELLKR